MMHVQNNKNILYACKAIGMIEYVLTREVETICQAKHTQGKRLCVVISLEPAYGT